MRKVLIILISTAITALNINCYGALDDSLLEGARLIAQTSMEIELTESINLGIGSLLFKIFHTAEILFLSEVGRRKLNNQF